jgi:hypothetical protein
MFQNAPSRAGIIFGKVLGAFEIGRNPSTHRSHPVSVPRQARPRAVDSGPKIEPLTVLSVPLLHNPNTRSFGATHRTYVVMVRVLIAPYQPPIEEVDARGYAI